MGEGKIREKMRSDKIDKKNKTDKINKIDKKDTSYPVWPMIKRLLQNVNKQNKKLYAYFAIFTIAAGIYPLFSVALPKAILDELIRPEGARLAQILIIAGVVFAGSALLGYIKTYIQSRTYFDIAYLRLDYIKDLFKKLTTCDYRYMEDADFYNENERAMSATGSNTNGVEGVYHLLFESPAILLTIILLTALIGVKSIIILLALILHIGITMYVGRRLHAYRHQKNKEIGRANRKREYFLQTTHDFGYGKDIRIYGLKERVLANFKNEINSYVAIFKAIFAKEFKLSLLPLATMLISDIVIYGILIRDTVNGMPISDFSMYLTAIITLSALLKAFINNLTTAINEGHYVHDFFEFMDRDLGDLGNFDSEGPERANPINKSDTLEIELKNVSFKYPKTEKYIIQNLNLKINKGERVAIVGINGAGKSTIIKLITGLFDITEGELLINQRPIQNYNKKELYSLFSVVFQDINVLAYPLIENIACTPNGDRARAEIALERAGLGEKLKSLPKGLDQPMLKIIEEDGTEFSGGESQKLAIARALYKNAPMIIMDEPTAALDALAEADIYQHFSDLVAGKTAIYISHRLASTKFCDRIAFFDGDGLKEMGSHDELMALKGSYYHMFTVQGKYYNTQSASNIDPASSADFALSPNGGAL